MSLQLAAQHLASRGRGGDSVLVHMSPEEVHALQKLAEAHGTSLTINPETGQPEAFSLKSLIPMIAGAALNYFAPGVGSAIGNMLGTSAAVGAGVAVGGIEALRTGDLGRGISAGLGAYGGASLGAGLEQLGGTAVSPEALQAANAATDPIAELAKAKEAAIAAGEVAPTGLEAAQKGLQVAADSPKSLVNTMGGPMGTAKTFGAALAPTLTEMPEPVEPPKQKGYYRGSSFDPISGEYTYYEPIPLHAAGGGVMSAADLMYSNDPVIRMADGGISANLPSDWGTYKPEEKIGYYAAQGITPDQLRQAGAAQSDLDWMAQQTDLSRNADLVKQAYADIGRTGVGAAASQIDPEGLRYWTGQLASGAISPDDFQKAFTTSVRDVTQGGANEPVSNYVSDYVVNKIAQPTVTSQEFLTGTSGLGIEADPLAEAIARSDFSKGAQYSLTHADIGDPGNIAETYGGLKGLSSNINYWIDQHPNATLNDLRNEMTRWELNDADIIRATGKTPEQLYADSMAKVINPVPGAGGQTGPGAIGGGTVVNPNGTITTSPNIPDIPVGGFTGMQDVRDVYTQGGGSLGYQPYVPKTYEEFEQKFTNTGGSKAAYDYLMGKTPYSPTPVTATGEVAKPYAESVLGVPGKVENKRYIFNPTTRTYEENPNFKPFVFDPQAPGLTVRGMSSNEAQDWVAQNPKASDADIKSALITNGKLSLAALAKLFNISLDAATKRFGSKTSDQNSSISSSDTGNASTNWSGAANGGIMSAMAAGGHAQYNLGDYSDGGRLLRGPGDGVSDDIPATIAGKRPARLADGEFVVPARIVSELGNGSTEAGARKLYAMMDRIQANRKKTVGKGKVAVNSRADKHLPA